MKACKKTARVATANFVLCFFLLFLFLYDPAASSEQLYRSLGLCAGAIVPSLFPFMVISEIFVRSGTVPFLSPVLEGISRKLFGVTGTGGAAAVLGAVCGFPVGAKVAATLYESELITSDEAERIVGFGSLPSAPFVIFAIGEKLFGSMRIGLFIYASVVASALICGALSARGRRKIHSIQKPIALPANMPPTVDIFTESVASAASAVIKICAYVSFFGAAVGGLSSITARLSPIFRAAAFSFLELSGGAAACSSLKDNRLGIVIASAAAGWSGLSVLCQIRSVTRTARGVISMKPYILMKAFSALFCALSAAVCVSVFPSFLPSLPHAEETLSPLPTYPEAFANAVNLFFIVSYLIYLSKKLDTGRKI